MGAPETDRKHRCAEAENIKRSRKYINRVFFSISEFCDESLGVEDPDVVPDSAFSASSSYDDANVGPHNARYVASTDLRSPLMAFLSLQLRVKLGGLMPFNVRRHVIRTIESILTR